MNKVAVVGGGFSGFATIAALKEEGMEPVCFEITDKPGGTWCYREESVDGVPSIMPTTVINHSKEMGAFSNYPPRKEFNNFMRHHELYQYAMEWCTERDILKHIHFNSEVTAVRKSEDYRKTGKWTVTIRNTISGSITSDTYDGVVLCVGHINRPKWPSYPNLEIFKGKIMHTHSLKGVEDFRNKRVLVIGMGCSGVDAAVETSNVAKQVYLSTRAGAHVISRQNLKGLPFDFIVMRRYIMQLLEILPASWMSWLARTIFIDPIFDHRLYPVEPQKPVLCKDPVFSDHLHSKLLSGAVIMKNDVCRFTENGVIFQEDTSETELDAVIMATGYTWKFPFLEEGIIVKEDEMFNLYKLVFPYHLPHATLAVIGFIMPFGPGFPIGEIQCRWMAHIFSGAGKLPPKDVMIKDIRDRYRKSLARFGPDEKASLRVDHLPYLDDIASKLGVKPNFLKMFFTDIKLFVKLWFGPFLNYQYRLQGPHKWDGAREAIMTCEKRVVWPLKKSDVSVPKDRFLMRWLKKLIKLVFHDFF